MNETPTCVSEREIVSYEKAIGMLPDGEIIHTFRSNSYNMLVGADWKREDILVLIKRDGAELSGKFATAMQHGLWVNDGVGRGLFIATK